MNDNSASSSQDISCAATQDVGAFVDGCVGPRSQEQCSSSSLVEECVGSEIASCFWSSSGSFLDEGLVRAVAHARRGEGQGAIAQVSGYNADFVPIISWGR